MLQSSTMTQIRFFKLERILKVALMLQFMLLSFKKVLEGQT